MPAKTIVGGILASILLGIYGYLMWLAIAVVYREGCDLACQQRDFNQSMAAALITIGGLVSGVIIAELAITKPNETPAARFMTPTPNQSEMLALKIVVYAYMAVWLIAGLAAFVVALNHEDAHKPLRDAGNAWLGLAIAAGYAYFGINRPDTQGGR
jgi:hypothetical protein